MVIALQRQRPIMVFRGDLSINSAGVITGITAAPLPFDERESLWGCCSHFNGLFCWQIKGLMGADFSTANKNEARLTYKHLCVII